ncbi:MAG TPA: HD domain-containing phosphohydrolase [Armatimonadota bacterium]|nr:HD domain-containing phosphohydrolase [Armatimonadota bacterium]
MSFSKLPFEARFYIVLSIAVSLAVCVVSLMIWPLQPDLQFYFLIVLALVISVSKVDLTVGHGRMTLINTAVFMTIMLRESVSDTLLIAMIGAVATHILVKPKNPDGTLRPRTWYRPTLTTANLIQSSFIGAWLWHEILPGPSPTTVTRDFLLALLLMTCSYFLANTVGIALAVALSQRLDTLKVWKENFLWTFPGYLYTACAAAAAAVLYSSGLWLGSFLLLPPVYVVYYSYKLYLDKINTELRHVQELNQLNSRVISTLAMTIEAKDRYTHKHVERVTEYAMAIAREMGVSGSDLEAVRIGAMVHDIGKIAVPESILTKPGKLTPEEFERMKAHVAVGVRILEAVNFPFPVTDAVVAHHEQWDGNGYPAGLKGEEIPLVGRIVAVADGFDALTSDRHYRKKLSTEEALELMVSLSGQRYDPRVVASLSRSLPGVKSVIDELDRQEWHADELAGRRRMIPQEALEEIARAAEEAVVLAEMSLKPNISRSPTEVIDLLLDKALTLLPATTAAVFILDEGQDEIMVQGCRGLYGRLLQDLTMKVGEGVSGWVVAHGEAAELNTPAAGDLARRVAPGHNLELNSTLSAPLESNGVCMGAITLYHTGYNLYNTHHLRLLTTLAEHASGALDTLSQLRRNQVLANTDSLTELPNTRFLIQHLEMLTTERQTRFSILLLDLNGFKQINDTHGHLEGDRVLHDVAHILRECTRVNDLPCRYAGDEFIVVCDDSDLHECGVISDRIREGFRDYCCENLKGLILSASIGAASYPVDGADWRSLVAVADRRMYSNKLNYYSDHPPIEQPHRDLPALTAV